MLFRVQNLPFIFLPLILFHSLTTHYNGNKSSVNDLTETKWDSDGALYYKSAQNLKLN